MDELNEFETKITEINEQICKSMQNICDTGERLYKEILAQIAELKTRVEKLENGE